jgi:hypothetical protein
LNESLSPLFIPLFACNDKVKIALNIALLMRVVLLLSNPSLPFAPQNREDQLRAKKKKKKIITTRPVFFLQLSGKVVKEGGI